MKKLLILALLVFNSVVSAKTYYVATTGKDSNPGTIASPWATWKKGFETAIAGDTVFIRGGIYKPVDVPGSNYIEITGRNGTRENPICIFAYPADYESGNIPTLDCSLQVPSEAGYNTAIQVGSSSHYKFKGLTVCNVWQSSIGKIPSAWCFYECNNLYFEACTAHQIGGRGFYVLNYSPAVVDSTFFINCDAYDCADSLTIDGNGNPNPGNGADGFFIQMTYDFTINYCLLEGCRAWRCSDDQFNLDQDCLTVTRNCWAFSGGYSSLSKSEGNGFKIGDPNPKTPEIYSRITYNCISAGNKGFGYDPNNGLGDEWPRSLYYNNLSYKNSVGFLVQNCTESPLADTMNIYKNNISYLDSYAAFENVPCLQQTPYYYTVDHCTWLKSEGYNGCMGLTNPNYNVTNDDFRSLDISELDDPRKSDGSLPDINFGKLAEGSDLINGGIADNNFIRLGLTYNGTAPDLGFCEYKSGEDTPLIPTYVSSVIETATPSRLEMTYSLALANIVPATSSFSVTVNSAARSVSAVSISGTKVLLTLASPVVAGDVITIAYTQPVTNPLQTPSMGKAASLTAKNVTNNVLPATPVYISSVIETATPSRLEMTYSLALANIVPATSSFSVTVNSAARSVSAVSISGTKVLLTLASPVVAGDVITIAYTQPVTNPLQTPSTGKAASLTAKNVTNHVLPATPVYISSVIENATPSRLEMTYSLALANIVPATSSFSVMVNSAARSVSAVSISGTKVLLTLVSPAVAGDVITIAYTQPGTNPLQTPSAGKAASLTAKNVTNNVLPATPVYISSVIENATPSRLEMTYSLALANIVPATSSFSVTVNSAARSVSAVSISGTKVLLTLASPVVAGDVITVSYTKPTVNPLQTSSGGQAASISAKSVINNCSQVANQPPIISITSPTKSVTFTAPANITIEANASDPDGTISKVEFYNGSAKLGEKLSSPFSFTWKEVVEGNYTITAVASDNLNARTVSVPVEVVVEKSASTVNQLPVITITSPPNYKKGKKRDDFVLKAEAYDPDGSIVNVSFKNGSTTLAEITTPPYEYRWEDVDTGTFTITAIAMDNLGAITASSPMELKILDWDGNAEIIRLYPNPNDGTFTVDFYSGLNDQKNVISVVNLSGKTIFSDEIATDESTRSLNINNQSAGTYILMISSGKEIIAARKFIKK